MLKENLQQFNTQLEKHLDTLKVFRELYPEADPTLLQELMTKPINALKDCASNTASFAKAIKVPGMENLLIDNMNKKLHELTDVADHKLNELAREQMQQSIQKGFDLSPKPEKAPSLRMM